MEIEEAIIMQLKKEGMQKLILVLLIKMLFQNNLMGVDRFMHQNLILIRIKRLIHQVE